jgi:hypothetical protein
MNILNITYFCEYAWTLVLWLHELRTIVMQGYYLLWHMNYYFDLLILVLELIFTTGKIV